MKKASRNISRRKKTSFPLGAVGKWAVAIVILGAIAYALSQGSGVPYNEKDIAVVDFSNLSAKGKRTALQAANQARCGCGCGLTLAQCVATDSTCPIREGNIERIKTIVRNTHD